MSNDMSLNIKNFGLIKEANLNIGKINVVVGKNNTGKSTSSKILYCFLNAASNDGIKLANKSIKDKLLKFVWVWSNQLSDEYLEVFNKLDGLYFKLREHNLEDSFENEYDALVELAELLDERFKEKYLFDLDKIGNLIQINKQNNARYFNICRALLKSEFDFELDKDAIIELSVENGGSFNSNLVFRSDNIKGEVSGDVLYGINYPKIVYIDSTSNFEINKKYSKNDFHHLNLLYDKLSNFEEVNDVYDDIYNEDIIKFKEKFDYLINGQFKFDYKNNEFIFVSENKKYSMNNTSSGLKQLGILQVLLENRELVKDSFLIIDEVELNLHPEWQIKFAEVLILLVKELNISLYINTHSPFLAEAMEVYYDYYSLDEEINFYLTEEIGKNEFKFNNVPICDAVKVYDNLGNPFDEIEKIRLKTELRNDMR